MFDQCFKFVMIWLTIRDIGNFDSAVCSSDLRLSFLKCLVSNKEWLKLVEKKINEKNSVTISWHKVKKKFFRRYSNVSNSSAIKAHLDSCGKVVGNCLTTTVTVFFF